METYTPPANAQEAYERIRAYFSEPGAVLAKSEYGSCYYRAEDGIAKCAVGCLIPDELYDKIINEDDGETLGEAIEGNALSELVDFTLLKPIVNGDDEVGQNKLHFLEDAQRLHDRVAASAADFVVKLDALARDFDLAKEKHE